MVVCLIIPPSPFLLDERVFVSLGVLRVAASLEQNGVKVELLDLSGVSNYEDALRAHLKTSLASHYGVTTTTPQMPSAARIARVIREVKPQAIRIIGGPHPTLICAAKKIGAKRAPEALAKIEELFDVIVAGDGEMAIFPTCVFIKETPEKCQIIDADDPPNPYFMTKETYDASPWPARHLVDLESYKYEIDGHRATSLIAQLGCPFGCGFCGGRASPMLRRIRTRTTENIVRELRFLYKTRGYTGFMFYDDELNVNKGLVGLMDEISRLQDELKAEFRLRGFVKAELFTKDQAEAMYRAGFRWLLTGFESGAPRILENIEKRASQGDNTRCSDTAKRARLKVKALMSVGHPGESEETVQQTEDWLLRVQPDDLDVTIITTYPGSPYYDRAVETSPGIWTYSCKNGDRLHAHELDYTMAADYYKGDPDGGYRSYVFTDSLSEDGLVRLRDRVERTVRQKLSIPFNQSRPAKRYEHSMGQGLLPADILRKSV